MDVDVDVVVVVDDTSDRLAIGVHVHDHVHDHVHGAVAVEPWATRIHRAASASLV